MDNRFAQQLKKGVLELLVLKLICREATYGYDLLTQLKERSGGMFQLKEGTLYPILYRLEDEGMITASWTGGEGRVTPRKIYAATEKGRKENLHRQIQWQEFTSAVNAMLQEEEQ